MLCLRHAILRGARRDLILMTVVAQKGLYCATHKLEGMVNVARRWHAMVGVVKCEIV